MLRDRIITSSIAGPHSSTTCCGTNSKVRPWAIVSIFCNIKSLSSNRGGRIEREGSGGEREKKGEERGEWGRDG